MRIARLGVILAIIAWVLVATIFADSPWVYYTIGCGVLIAYLAGLLADILMVRIIVPLLVGALYMFPIWLSFIDALAEDIGFSGDVLVIGESVFAVAFMLLLVSVAVSEREHAG